jgi:hypothetical protein
MEIPFLELQRIDSKLRESLTFKFSEMLQKGVYSGGEEVMHFESKISVLLHSSFSISCANGTDALELALRAVGVGVGDEVIVPALTWVSTAGVVKMVGAIPVFSDTDEDGLLAADWENAINSNTKAIIAVHLYGKMIQMESLIKKAHLNDLFVIEDAALGNGAIQENRAAGTFADIGCLSFYPTKNLGALGEAGMCITENVFLAQQMRLLSNHGQLQRGKHELIGRSSRSDTIQAGFLNVMADEFEGFQKKEKAFATLYLDGLKDITQIKLPLSILEPDGNALLFVIQTQRRDELQLFLKSKGVGTAIHYPAIIPEMLPFKGVGEFENTITLSQMCLSLPLNPWLNEEEVLFIVHQINIFFLNSLNDLD